MADHPGADLEHGCHGSSVLSNLFVFLGTGKTVVGTHIVYWFHKLNEESVEKELTLSSEEEKTKGRKCILYCGPSNKSVDVVAGNYRF